MSNDAFAAALLLACVPTGIVCQPMAKSLGLDAAGDTVAIGIPLVGVVKIYRLT